jgi:hypothetical protein
MPLPGRDKTFALENCRDLLNKLEREIDRLSAARDRDDLTTMIDTAFNARSNSMASLRLGLR